MTWDFFISVTSGGCILRRFSAHHSCKEFWTAFGKWVNVSKFFKPLTAWWTFSGRTVRLTDLSVKSTPHLISLLLYAAKLPAEDSLRTNLNWHGKLIMEIEIHLYTHAAGSASAKLPGKGQKKREKGRKSPCEALRQVECRRIYRLTSAL